MHRPNESPLAEAFRIARTNIEHATADGRRVIMLNALDREKGETPAITANLALALARNATRTILVDLDLRRAAVDQLFGMEHRHGLTDVIAGRLDLDDVLLTFLGDEVLAGTAAERAGYVGPARGVLELLPVGSPPVSVGELIASGELRDLVARLRERSDRVVIHGPPLLGTADALALAAVVDGLIPVAGVGDVRRDVLSGLGNELATRVETLGVIATGVGRVRVRPAPRRRGGSPADRTPVRGRADGNGARTDAPAQAATRR
jgi:succinoglycan biosynthesis transport protein ExoP